MAKKRKTTEEQIAEIERLAAEGMPCKQIAKLVGVTGYTADYYARGKHKTIRPPKPKAPPKPKPQKFVPGCKHRDCVFWRPLWMRNVGSYACHYSIDTDMLRPCPAAECPGFDVFQKPMKRLTSAAYKDKRCEDCEWFACEGGECVCVNEASPHVFVSRSFNCRHWTSKEK